MNFYVLLGVGPHATNEEIKRAYRRLARKYHPDINPGDRQAAQVFERITRAYDTLTDPDRRSRYDVHGDAGVETGASSVRFQGFDFSVSIEEGRAPDFVEVLGEMLNARARGGAAGPEPGPDLHVTVSITFEQSILGGHVTVNVTRLERCAPCGGRGSLDVPETTCVHCDGRGHVRGVHGHMVFSRTCAACGGTGLVRHRACVACGGEGVGVHSGPIAIDIPPGIAADTQLVIPGEGHAGRRGGAPGSLRVTLSVLPHPYFRRAGNDVTIDVPLAVHEAALGTRIDVPTLDGSVRLRVPPGTQSGQTFRLRQRGVPMPDGSRGDLVATARVVLPPILDQRSRELLREFGTLHPEDVRAAWGLSEATSPSDQRPATSDRSDAATGATARGALGRDAGPEQR